MNFRWVIFIVVFMFVIIGSANAQNATDNLTADCDVKLAEINPDDINVTFEEQMWEENLSEISVDLPDDAEGNFTVKINDVEIYNRTIKDKSFKVPVILPKPEIGLIANIYPPMDYMAYKVSAFYNDIDLNIDGTLKVMKFSSNISNIHFPEEILQYGQFGTVLTFPRSASGIVEVYVDNRLLKTATAQPILYFDDDPFSKLELGCHTVNIVYRGDGYYKPFNRSFEFLETNVRISIPKNVNIGHDDCISVETLPNLVGTVSVYIDNALVSSSKTENGDFILSLEPYLKVNSREVKVIYKNGALTRQKSQLINVTYDFDVYIPQLVYGEENIIDILLPDTLNTKLLTVTVDGVRYPFSHPSNIMNNALEVDVSKISAGNHTMTVSFAGDARFRAKSESYNFTVDYAVITPDEVVYGDSSRIYLNLPQDADGSLEVHVDGSFYRISKLVNGHAEILIDSLNPGWHDVTASYTGSDYDVLNADTYVRIQPKITVDYRFTASEAKYITLEVPKDCYGYAVFNIDGKDHKVSIKNGIARYSLSKLAPGEHEINVEFWGENGFEDDYNWFVVTVYKPKIKIISSEATFKGINVKVKLLNKNNKPMANKKMTITINKKKYTIKTNKKGIAVLNKKLNLKSKKAKVTVRFMTSKAVKNLKVKNIILNVKKTSKRIVVKAYIKKPNKNKRVTFKINKKTYRVKIKKGIAKISVKKPKSSSVKITAKYLKDSAKYTLKA